MEIVVQRDDPLDEDDEIEQDERDETEITNTSTMTTLKRLTIGMMAFSTFVLIRQYIKPNQIIMKYPMINPHQREMLSQSEKSASEDSQTGQVIQDFNILSSESAESPKLDSQALQDPNLSQKSDDMTDALSQQPPSSGSSSTHPKTITEGIQAISEEIHDEHFVLVTMIVINENEDPVIKIWLNKPDDKGEYLDLHKHNIQHTEALYTEEYTEDHSEIGELLNELISAQGKESAFESGFEKSKLIFQGKAISSQMKAIAEKIDTIKDNVPRFMYIGTEGSQMYDLEGAMKQAESGLVKELHETLLENKLDCEIVINTGELCKT